MLTKLPSDPAPTARELEAAQHAARILHATLIPDSVLAYICDRQKPGSCGPGKYDLTIDIRVGSRDADAARHLDAANRWRIFAAVVDLREASAAAKREQADPEPQRHSHPFFSAHNN
jgi:hypothetical protein